MIELPGLEGAHHRDILDSLRVNYATNRDLFIKEFARQFGDRAIVQPHALIAYSYDATSERHRPDAVLIAHNEDEVARATQLAKAHHIPVIGRGSASNISGGTIPILGGLVISMAPMKSIVSCDWDLLEVTTEPGVINAQLQAYLGEKGFFYPPDPASHKISSLGGNVAESSGGPHCIKYGVTSHYVHHLRGVLASGEIVAFPSHFDLIDWSGLITGSEGTLALVTQMTLGFVPKPAHTQTLLAAFDSLTRAVTSVSEIMASRIIPSTLELLDRATIESVQPFIDAGFPSDADAVLLIEVDGPEPAALDAQMTQIEKILGDGAIYFEKAQNPAHAALLMEARRASYGALARLGSHIWVQDVTVPRPHLAEMMEFVLTMRDTYQLTLATVAHAGDGNLHPLIAYHSKDEWQRILEADAQILKKAAELGGSITGEHGIGIDKLESLPLMYSQEALQLMVHVKTAFDPHQLLNPGKAIYPESAITLPVAPDLSDYRPHPSIIDVGDVAHAIWTATQSQTPVVVRSKVRRPPHAEDPQVILLDHLNKVHDYDPNNLTLEVETGITMDAIAALLRPDGLQFPARTHWPEDTIADALAINLSHRNQFNAGPLKNWILGMQIITSDARQIAIGKKVVKNAAGLDLTKLFIGSLDTFGIATRAILRLIPQPPESRYGHLTISPREWDRLVRAIQHLSRSSYRPNSIRVYQEPQSADIHMIMDIEQWDIEAAQAALDHILSPLTTVTWSDHPGDHQAQAWEHALWNQAFIEVVDSEYVRPSTQSGFFWHLGGSIMLPYSPDSVPVRGVWRIHYPHGRWEGFWNRQASSLDAVRHRLINTLNPHRILGTDWIFERSMNHGD